MHAQTYIQVNGDVFIESVHQSIASLPQAGKLKTLLNSKLHYFFKDLLFSVVTILI